jgi:predicted DNA-binding protein with PD1-like motif
MGYDRHDEFKGNPMKFFSFVLICLALCFLLPACQNTSHMNPITPHAIRLRPGQLLREEIEAYVKKHRIEAGWIGSCAGSLTQYHIRFANQGNGSKAQGHFEIVSLSGTVSVNGNHLHISVSDHLGNTVGGHLLDSCTVFTTAEIILLETDRYRFRREKDGSTPWEELQIDPLPEP